MRALGELEDRIMRTLWRRESAATVREVHTTLSQDRSLAYTTVMTVMDRLSRKGLLHRRLRGRAYEYLPSRSEAEYTADLMHELLATTRDSRAVLAHFVGRMGKRDETELIRLAEEAAKRKLRR